MTDTKSECASYEFTTLTCIPGIIPVSSLVCLSHAGLDKSCTCVRGVLENSKFSYLRTPYIYILYVHDHHLSSLLVREETLKSSRTCQCLLHRRCSCRPCCFEEIRTTEGLIQADMEVGGLTLGTPNLGAQIQRSFKTYMDVFYF